MTVLSMPHSHCDSSRAGMPILFNDKGYSCSKFRGEGFQFNVNDTSYTWGGTYWAIKTEPFSDTSWVPTIQFSSDAAYVEMASDPTGWVGPIRLPLPSLGHTSQV